ncbi:hypothetical protein SDRG_10007 [Saprolegnia diclina VS20]|uniref:CHCH domain-containing protein n=1 Tax=Saprolegnia diclina (strain VS20) TaxID=1156394 RepID=T0RIR4_SAPDV|nr:hypothetical protein SDRG_10007 [Saprolegnia diclina VS20]EQC32258.1 hypothetical protein SDRG_10007 [Saprolegnia diclina VS20]|eukprot:XP_008614199.1 hypothetical protein SDRG_10007 [Saprolegnia diclina VS20]
MARSRRSAAPAPARRPAPAAKPAPAPAPVHAAPAPAPMQQQSGGGGMMAGLMGTVAQGMAFGTGSAIAHRAVGAVANSIGGGSDSQQQEAAPAAAAPQQANPCANQNKSFTDCLNANSNDVAACQFYFDQFKMCERQAQQQF